MAEHLHANRHRSGDPTRTTTIRRTYAQRLRGAFGRINTAIRQAVRDEDIFGLSDANPADAPDGLEVFADIDGPGDLASLSPGEQTRRFEDWLDDVQDSDVLAVIARDENRFIQRAYERGLEDGEVNLRRAGIDTSDALAVQGALNLPVHEDTLQRLFARNFAELDGITDEVARQATRELADGMAEGVNPNEMARRITDRVDAVGKTRATVLARTETINAYTESTLNRYERFGADGVTVQAEFTTAGDSDVCAVCQALEGTTRTIEDVRSESFTVDGSEFPVKPPVHPQCRCALLPVTSTTAAAAVEAHPAAFQTLFATGAFAGSDAEQRYAALAAA